MTTSRDVLGRGPVIPVVVLPQMELAVPLARALHRGGVSTIEVTLRTPAALEAVRRIAAEVPEVLVGVGTVTDPAAARRAAAAGARFLVTPGATPAVLDAAEGTGLPLIPGAATVSEVLVLGERGHTALKLFPAEASGGRGWLASVASVLPDVVFCPTGGIGPRTVAEYLALANVACVGGSWLTPADVLERGDWDAVEAAARQASGLRG